MLRDLTPTQLELANYMSCLSEAAYCASWMDGLEFALWRLVLDGPFKYGQFQLSSEHRRRLIELSNACGGWIYFHGQAEETFSSMHEWLQLFQNEDRSLL